MGGKLFGAFDRYVKFILFFVKRKYIVPITKNDTERI